MSSSVNPYRLEGSRHLHTEGPPGLYDDILQVFRGRRVSVPPVEEVVDGCRQSHSFPQTRGRQGQVGQPEPARPVPLNGFPAARVLPLRSGEQLLLDDGRGQVELRQVPRGVFQLLSRGLVLAFLVRIAGPPLYPLLLLSLC